MDDKRSLDRYNYHLKHAISLVENKALFSCKVEITLSVQSSYKFCNVSKISY